MEFEPTEDDLLQLREWLAKMPHLLKDYDDQFLSGFIRGCKGSLHIAKQKLENLNALGKRYPQLYGSYDPFHPTLQENLKARLMFPLPKKNPNGCMVFVTAHNPDLDGSYKIYTAEIVRYYLLSLYVLLWENDFGSGKLIHVSSQQISSLKDGVHLFNVSTVSEYAFKIIKMVAKEKIVERFHLHSQLETEKDFPYGHELPKDILPKEFGGYEESVVVLHENWKKKVESYRDRLLQEEKKMRELDPIRPKSKDDDEMTGTFKQLNVD